LSPESQSRFIGARNLGQDSREDVMASTKHDDQAVELVERLPTADEYAELLRRVGWTPPPVEDCHRALGGSLTAICAVDEREAVVGMGRLVGDGRIYCFAVDVVVDPDAQGQGIGQGIMDPWRHS
jgi:GNAT superfamily N-acetyltransferase